MRIQDFLGFIRPVLRRIIMGGSQFHSEWGGRMFDLEFKLLTEVRPTIWFARTFGWANWGTVPLSGR